MVLDYFKTVYLTMYNNSTTKKELKIDSMKKRLRQTPIFFRENKGDTIS